MKKVYVEQLKVPGEKNWTNEVRRIRDEYCGITELDEEIVVNVATQGKEEWKVRVTDSVKKKTVTELNLENNSLSKSSYPDTYPQDPILGCPVLILGPIWASFWTLGTYFWLNFGSFGSHMVAFCSCGTEFV